MTAARFFMFLLLSLTLNACSPVVRPALDAPQKAGEQQCALPDTANQWFASSQTWQMEHSGVLQLGGKVLPLTGVMRLNLREKEILISIMSGFGLKLLAMKVRPETQEILYASPAADAIPHFIQHCADTLRALFLRFPDQAETCRNVGGLCVLEERIAGNVIRVGLDPQSGFLRQKTVASVRGTGDWTIRYDSPTVFQRTVFPKTVFCNAEKGEYSLNLELQQVERP